MLTLNQCYRHQCETTVSEKNHSTFHYLKKKKRHTQGFWKEETRLFSPSAAGNGTPASLGADLSCLMQRLALPTVNSPGHAPSQAALLTERVVVKAPSTTGITLAPSPCQPRFFFFFFWPGSTPGVFQPAQGMLQIQTDCLATHWG